MNGESWDRKTVYQKLKERMDLAFDYVNDVREKYSVSFRTAPYIAALTRFLHSLN